MAFVGVIGRLFREPYMYDFFQAVRLLETYFTDAAGVGESLNVAEERIRIRPHNGLVFPATDVRLAELLEGPPPRARLTATFMGLYGVDSPLPVYFFDSIATESEDSAALRDFLDIFNHRLYALFYRSWKKYRMAVQYSRPATRKGLAERSLSLAGLGTKKASDNDFVTPLRLAAFAGALSMRGRNAEGLQNLVAELLGGLQVKVVENIPRWVTVPLRSRLGRTPVPAIVGRTACIGASVCDATGKFRLVLGPLTLTQYLALLPGGEYARRMKFIVRLYVRDYLDYDAVLKLKTSEIPPLRLGDRALKLGLTTWLGKPAAAVTSREVAYPTLARSSHDYQRS